MLEIIGWLACVYLLVKGLEIIGSSAYRVNKFQSEETRLSAAALIAAILAIAGGLIFPFILAAQAGSFTASQPNTSTLTTEQVDCINSAGSDNQKILACTQ